MTDKTRQEPVLKPPPNRQSAAATLEERARKAIEIREKTAKATQGRPLTFPTRLARN